jgi:hypothetical protein
LAENARESRPGIRDRRIHAERARNFDAVVFGHFESGKLMYAGRTRSGFTPASRDQLFKRFGMLAAETCPFANLPEAISDRWGVGLTAEKMKECRSLHPSLVGQFEFVEWTADGETASHYTRSSNRTTKVSDHASVSPAHRS